MLSSDIRQFVISPSLKIINYWSDAAEILIYGTGMIETGYNYLMQEGQPAGGGLGFFQMESETFKDHRSWLTNNKNLILQNSIAAACYYMALPTDPLVMVSNIRYAVIMCRVHYLRVPEPLPNAYSAEDLARYYKVYYNTTKGKANIDKCIEVFKEILTNGRPKQP